MAESALPTRKEILRQRKAVLRRQDAPTIPLQTLKSNRPVRSLGPHGTFHHLSKSWLGCLGKTQGPGQSNENIALIALQNCSHEHGVRLGCFGPARHATEVGSLSLNVADLSLPY